MVAFPFWPDEVTTCSCCSPCSIASSWFHFLLTKGQLSFILYPLGQLSSYERNAHCGTRQASLDVLRCAFPRSEFGKKSVPRLWIGRQASPVRGILQMIGHKDV